jgi:predicted ferric reductase
VEITSQVKRLIMGNLLYLIAVVLVIGWLIGFVGYSAGGLIHILLVIAVIVILLRIISGKKIL